MIFVNLENNLQKARLSERETEEFCQLMEAIIAWMVRLGVAPQMTIYDKHEKCGKCANSHEGFNDLILKTICREAMELIENIRGSIIGGMSLADFNTLHLEVSMGERKIKKAGFNEVIGQQEIELNEGGTLDEWASAANSTLGMLAKRAFTQILIGRKPKDLQLLECERFLCSTSQALKIQKPLPEQMGSMDLSFGLWYLVYDVDRGQVMTDAQSNAYADLIRLNVYSALKWFPEDKAEKIIGFCKQAFNGQAKSAIGIGEPGLVDHFRKSNLKSPINVQEFYRGWEARLRNAMRSNEMWADYEKLTGHVEEQLAQIAISMGMEVPKWQDR